jgi:hypothetical protein
MTTSEGLDAAHGDWALVPESAEDRPHQVEQTDPPSFVDYLQSEQTSLLRQLEATLLIALHTRKRTL